MLLKWIREMEAEPGSSVSILTRLRAGGQGNWGSIRCENEDLSFPQGIPTGIHLASYLTGAASSSSGGKAAGA
jgi:hypothetical protein